MSPRSAGISRSPATEPARSECTRGATSGPPATQVAEFLPDPGPSHPPSSCVILSTCSGKAEGAGFATTQTPLWLLGEVEGPRTGRSLHGQEESGASQPIPIGDSSPHLPEGPETAAES
nr:neuromedin-B isoform X1 [Macaca fascicularis]